MAENSSSISAMRSAEASEQSLSELQEVNGRIEQLALDLKNEREERKIADIEAAKKLKISNRINRFFQIAALIISLVSISLAIHTKVLTIREKRPYNASEGESHRERR